MTSRSHGWGDGPAIEAELQTDSRQILGRFYSPVHGSVVKRVRLASTTVDAGNTPSTGELRAGLPLAYVDSTGEHTHWDPDAATGGQEHAEGLLLHDMSMQGYLTTAVDKPEVLMLTHGIVQADLIDDFTFSTSFMMLLKEQLGRRIIFDDDIACNQAGLHPTAAMRQYRVTATSQTIGDTINNAVYLIASTAAHTTTLPAIIDGGGQYFRFIKATDNNLIITSAEGNNVIGIDDFAASTATFATAGELIGTVIDFISINSNGVPLWLPLNLNGTTVAYT